MFLTGPSIHSNIRFHRNLLSWHSKHFAPIEKALSQTEHEYLESCFEIYQKQSKKPQQKNIFLKDFFYAYKVENGELNASILAYGSLEGSDRFRQAVRDLLDQKEIQLPKEHSMDQTYGFAWDLKEKNISVFIKKMNRSELFECSYIQGKLFSQTLYQDQKCFPQAQKATSGERQQISWKDRTELFIPSQSKFSPANKGMLTLEQPWHTNLHPHGKRVIEAYRRKGEKINKILFKNQNQFTLFFP